MREDASEQHRNALGRQLVDQFNSIAKATAHTDTQHTQSSEPQDTPSSHRAWGPSFVCHCQPRQSPLCPYCFVCVKIDGGAAAAAPDMVRKGGCVGGGCAQRDWRPTNRQPADSRQAKNSLTRRNRGLSRFKRRGFTVPRVDSKQRVNMVSEDAMDAAVALPLVCAPLLLPSLRWTTVSGPSLIERRDTSTRRRGRGKRDRAASGSPTSHWLRPSN
jgi:hypothetical protein